MTVTKDDFEKIWASTSPLTPYSFSDAQYKEGWNFVGSTPPSRQMWDAFMQNADEKLKYLYQHEDVPIGHEYFTFNPNIPQGSLPLFGGEYSRATYSDLWAWVQQQTGYLKTEAEWQTLSTANNGNVPYYSSGDGSTTFRVPSLKCWVRGANGTVSEVGSYLEAGLPNITGYLTLRPVSDPTIIATDGVFSKENASETATSAEIGSQTYNRQRAIFNASNSNSIYGNANTVQPESIVGMWLVKAYGVIVDTGTIDEQQYIDDRIAAEITRADGKYESVVASGTDYIRYESGLQMCWGSTTANADGTTVTFPVAFLNVPQVVTSNGMSAYTIKSYPTDLSATSVVLKNTETTTARSIRYIAIGTWK